MNEYPAPPLKFLIVDKSNRGEHTYISRKDICLYLWERMSNVWKTQDWEKYPTNRLISNLQIKLSERHRLKYKDEAIRFAASALNRVMPADYRDYGTFVPMPPSKVKGDAEYDDRLIQVLRGVKRPLDVRELVIQTRNVDSKQKGVGPVVRAESLRVAESACEPRPKVIFVFDDVLTTGSHFKAMQIVLSARFPGVPICGIFLARAVRQNDDTVDRPVR